MQLFDFKGILELTSWKEYVVRQSNCRVNTTKVDT